MMPWQVLSVEDSVSTVRFIDYGNTEQKTLEEMFRLGINHPLVTCLKRQAPILPGEGPRPGCASVSGGLERVLPAASTVYILS